MASEHEAMKLNLRFQTCGQDELPRKDKFDRYVFHLEIWSERLLKNISEFVIDTSGVAFTSDNTLKADTSKENLQEEKTNLTGIYSI